jgi:hypothetical protein
VAPFNILDSETRRADVSLHVPPMADPNDDEEFTASPFQRRSSRHKRSSLPNDARESSSSESGSKRSKVLDKALNHSLPLLSLLIHCGSLLIVLIGKKLKYFSGFDGALGTVTDYLLDHDAYRLEYSDGI